MILFNINKFEQTKICFSTVDHNAYGSLSRTKRLAFTGFFMVSSNAFTVLKFLVPSGVPDITFPCHGAGTTTVTHTTTCIRWSPHRLLKLIKTGGEYRSRTYPPIAGWRISNPLPCRSANSPKTITQLLLRLFPLQVLHSLNHEFYVQFWLWPFSYWC